MRRVLVRLLAFVCLLGFAACQHVSERRFPNLAMTGKTKVQWVRCDFGKRGLAVFIVDFSEIETGDWKISRMRVQIGDAAPVTLSDAFIRGMWSPDCEINAPVVIARAPLVVRVDTGDGGESKSACLTIRDDGAVIEGRD